jgi:geranylgeranyl pyrophosphate synthase
MRDELDRVDQRVLAAARVDFPLVATMVEEIVSAGGKRLRPLLLLLSARAYDYDVPRLVTAAAGVELLHTASLIHDDSIDRAAIRRGKPTLNARLSSGAVILIGDFLFAQSAMLAAATEHTRVVAIFASTLGDICDGQLREMLDGHRIEQTRAEYERRIYGKTAALFAGAAEMGAVIGQAPPPDIEALRAFGSDLGMAFQIVDDVLDVREGSRELGKPAGNDLRQGIVTLPTMLFAASLPPDSSKRGRLDALVEGELTDESAIDDLIAAIRSSGAIEEAVGIAHDFAERARRRLSDVADGSSRAMLEELVELTVERHS